jgi:hypothetical protein
MCIHPEALARVKNFSPTRESHYHDCRHSNDPNLPSQAQWMIRHTNHPSTQQEKFALRAEAEIVREGG